MVNNKIQIIAECCQNHSGNFKTLREMVKEASKNGANFVKIQCIFADSLSFRPRFENGIKKKNKVLVIKRPYFNEYKRLKKLELNKRNLIDFIKICNDYSVYPLITCFTRKEIDFIYDIGFRNIKIASYDCSSFQFLREIRKKFKKIIVSTGATYYHEIKKAAQILDGVDYVFLHCVTIYPTPLDKTNLLKMDYLKKFTKNFGFSDHSLVKKYENFISFNAILRGAKYIERHFTILKPYETRDGRVSINPKQLQELRHFSDSTDKGRINILKKYSKKFLDNKKKILGSKKQYLSNEELLNRDYYKGRFLSKIKLNNQRIGIYNWEEVPINDF